MTRKALAVEPVEGERLTIQYVRLSEAVLWDRNAKLHDLGALISSIKRYGFRDAPILDATLGAVAAGNGRIEALRQMKDAGDPPPKGVHLVEGGEWVVPVQVGLDARSRAEAEAFGLDHNNLTLLGGNLGVDAVLRLYDQEQLKAILLDVNEAGEAPISLDGADLDALMKAFSDDKERAENSEANKRKLGVLVDRFIVPPFSVLDTRKGYWKDRIAQWMELGVRSWRPENLLGMSDSVRKFDPYGNKSWVQGYGGGSAWVKKNSGTSIFDPVLCELAYRWYCPKGGSALDPFAGSSVSGVVAAVLGISFWGIDLSHKQVEGCVENWNNVGPRCAEVFGTAPVEPHWLRGDSREMADVLKAAGHSDRFDLLFSCPPYFNLEQYSDDASDLSAQNDYAEFLAMYEDVIRKGAERLKDDRFCVWVVPEVRDKKGRYLGFVADSIKAFQRAGMHLYNEAAQVLNCGSAALRATRIFSAQRKLVRAHQNVLVFVKGDPEKAAEALGPLEMPPDMEALIRQRALEDGLIDSLEDDGEQEWEP